jgi:SH3 domain protein
MRLFFRIGIMALITLTGAVEPVSAETKYISEKFEVTLRTGPASNRKIIGLIPTGKQVDVVNPGGQWSEVIWRDKQGWVQSRFLTNQEPTSMALAQLRGKYSNILAQNEELKQKVVALSAVNNQLGTELNQAKADLGSLSGVHNTLKEESADFLKLKANYEKAVQEMNAARAKAEKVESDYNKIANSDFNRGLLYGGGLLVFGFIFGLILKRPGRKSPLM